MAPAKSAPPAKLNRLRAALQASDWAAARLLAAKLMKTAPKDPDVLSLAAHVAIKAENDAERAKRLARRAVSLDRDRHDALSALEIACMALGERDEAADAFERRIAMAPTAGSLYYGLAAVALDRAAAYRERLERRVVDPQIAGFERSGMFAALGLLREAEGAYDGAFEAFAASKRLVNRPYAPAEYESLLAFWRRHAAQGGFETGRPAGVDDRRMTFIVGLPRSGTTLIERILAAHPEVEALGERAELGKALRSLAPRADRDRGALNLAAISGAPPAALARAAEAYLDAVRPFARTRSATRWIDKLPGNFVHCGAIATLFPNARIVIATRDPRDVFVSCWRTFFATGNAFSETMERFAHHYGQFRGFSNLWAEALGDRVLVAPYEELVADVDTWSRRLIAHIGLDWDPACARPHEQQATVQTASTFQVRAPVHTRSIGGWRRYAAQIAPLLEAIEAQDGSDPATLAA